MSETVFGKIINPRESKMRVVDPREIFPNKRPRMLLTSVTLPSQYNSYAVCTEFAKEWFLEKYPQQYFNSVYMDGSKSFDQFRQFSQINQQLKRTNPLLAITPSIDLQHNRDFIDTNMELTGHLRRTRMEGVFFSDYDDPDKAVHLAIQFKTIKMNFIYKIRLDTKAEMIDEIERIKYKHRAGMTETRNLPLEIHVPRKIICQIAFDHGMLKEDYTDIRNPDEMLQYLNSHSFLPFLYKRRNATGTYEFFIRVENCTAHIKADFPSGDEQGDRVDQEQMNFTLEFNTEIEMTAPYCYTYYSTQQQNIIESRDIVKDETAILLVRARNIELPNQNENKWNRVLKTEYLVEDSDLRKPPIIINFEELLAEELFHIVEYTKAMYLNPSLFIDFIIFNNLDYIDYSIDWDKYEISINDKCTDSTFHIGMYVDLKYINNVKIHHNFSDGFNSQDSFRTTSRIGKIE